LSRNGSSGAGIGVGAGHLRSGGLASGAAGRGVGSRAGTATLEEDESTDVDIDAPPEYQEDEGVGDESPFAGLGYAYHEPWNFANVPINSRDHAMDDGDDMASDHVAMGSNGGDDLEDRMLQDFGDDQVHPGTPMSDDEVPDLLPEDRNMITSALDFIPPMNVITPMNMDRMDWDDNNEVEVKEVLLDDAEDPVPSHAKTD
jgi:ubiquitin carboxyl-terminal hydrolase 4/11/15